MYMINWSSRAVPLEIIYHVCKWLKRSELYPCLLINKKWNSIILPLYWKNLRISNNKQWTNFICSTAVGKGIEYIKNFSFSDIQELSSTLNIYEYKSLDFIIDSRINRFIHLIETNNTNLSSLEFIGIKSLNEHKLIDICKFCPQLEGLYIHCCGISYYVKDFEKIANYCPYLKKLHLGRNSTASYISDLILKTILISFKQLNELTISFSSLTDASSSVWKYAKRDDYDLVKRNDNTNCSLNGYHQKGLTWLSLSELGYPMELFNIPGTISNHLFWKEMLQTIGSQLEALDLSACGRYLNENVLYQIEETCPNLMALNLSANYCVNDELIKHLLPKLVHLCHLHLCACNLLTDKVLEYIGEYSPPKLQFLGLCMRGGDGRSSQFSSQNLYRMVTKCPKLKNISLGLVDKEIKDRIHQYLKLRNDQYQNKEDFTLVEVDSNGHYKSCDHSLKNKSSSESNKKTNTSVLSFDKDKKIKSHNFEYLHPFHCFCKESFLFHNNY
ncbi:RNI-like protein [Piromyces finnis]|uniref:RNI-like protein n=1 Tax=Piromyces finnis TaxID=1754191 RepID=A0A1Y1V2R8_9FUNG|nr:RNI-like protein [Piromyces finnis]|eukprot:ORX45179.1 RNI-like protein [Piromyces finnis]